MGSSLWPSLWASLAFGFLAGSIPFGVLVGRTFFNTDIRASGSGNIGAANALRTMGKKAGAAILVLDALKGALAIAVASRLVTMSSDPQALACIPLAGLAAVLGHCYTPWLRFRGGKGVATYLGALFALSWEAGAIFVLIWLAVVLRAEYASLGSMSAAILAGAAFMLLGGSARYGIGAAMFAVGAAAVIVWQHRENIARLRAGGENRTSLIKR
ncbi:MAG: glycerol-3-phosphate 1-O-acyltransferase PlsY [Candidatus Eremiobacteraeota bacterium]|nr:glycerol-3-phosphate 1-O-acyltransferase PlsY [Candidatus Eremiobacteraeota bacterium]